jgi:hypothetical protein
MCRRGAMFWMRRNEIGPALLAPRVLHTRQALSLLRAETAHLRRATSHSRCGRRSGLPVASHTKPAACQDRDPAGSNCGSGPRPLPGPRVFTAPADCLSRGALPVCPFELIHSALS